MGQAPSKRMMRSVTREFFAFSLIPSFRCSSVREKLHLRYREHLFIGFSPDTPPYCSVGCVRYFLAYCFPRNVSRTRASPNSFSDSSPKRIKTCFATDLSLPVTLQCKRILTFLRLFSFEVVISFSVAKLVHSWVRFLRILSNGIAAKIFLYRDCVLWRAT